MNDTQSLLGKVLNGPQERDAIHIAVAPVVASCNLQPGDHIGFNADGKVGTRGAHIGIVDPFLSRGVVVGEQFWMFLYPNTITGLWHGWTHPAFSAHEDAAHRSKEYLEGIARRLGSTLDDMLGAIRAGHFCLPDDIDNYDTELDAVFWANYTAYTGHHRPTGAPSYFRCAC